MDSNQLKSFTFTYQSIQYVDMPGNAFPTRNGQLSIDYIAGAIVFFGAIIVLISGVLNTVPQFQNTHAVNDLELTGWGLSEVVMSDTGYWQNVTGNGTDWHTAPASDTVVTGLQAAGGDGVSLNKVDALRNMDYSTLQNVLGTQQDFTITFTRFTPVDTYRSFTGNTPESADIIDSFEDGALNEYDGETSAYTVSSVPNAADGQNVIRFTDTSTNYREIYSTSGLPIYPSQGDVIHYNVRSNVSTGSPENVYSHLQFGYQDTNNLYKTEIQHAEEKWTLYIRQGGAYYKLDGDNTISGGLSADTWYQVEIDWGADGNITARLYDGSTLKSTLTGVDNNFTSGGISLRHSQTPGSYIDYDNIRVLPDAASTGRNKCPNTIIEPAYPSGTAPEIHCGTRRVDGTPYYFLLADSAGWYNNLWVSDNWDFTDPDTTYYNLTTAQAVILGENAYTINPADVQLGEGNMLVLKKRVGRAGTTPPANTQNIVEIKRFEPVAGGTNDILRAVFQVW